MLVWNTTATDQDDIIEGGTEGGVRVMCDYGSATKEVLRINEEAHCNVATSMIHYGGAVATVACNMVAVGQDAEPAG